MFEDTSRRFSPSKLGMYKECPRRYRYRYVDKIKSEAQSVEAFLGSRVHEALEELYSGVVHARLMSLEDLVRFYERRWDSEWSEAIFLRNQHYSREDWKNIGRECLSHYYFQHRSFDADKTVEVEKRIGFSLEVQGQLCRIEGFIDRLALGADGIFEIHDYKTGKSLPTQAEVDSDWQLGIYELAVRESWPDAPGVRLVWHYLRHGTSLRSRRSPEALERLKREIVSLIVAIKSDHEFPPRRNPLCDWCEYREICPLWSHAEKVSGLSAQDKKQEDGVRLVEEYGELEVEKKNLKARLKAIEEDEGSLARRILSFAKSRGYQRLSGIHGEVSIIEKEEYKFPTRTYDPEALESLERELKGTLIWEEVSHLDAHRLLSGYKRKEWPAQVLHVLESIIGRYARRVQERVLRYRSRKEDEEE
jgi:putative RecB family exonuclease